MSTVKTIRDWKKPCTYHKVMTSLLETGKPRGQSSSTLNAMSSNSGAHSSGCTGRHEYYIKDGILHPYAEGMCSKENPECRNIVVTMKRELHGKYLIVIPCNSGAEVGNYFTKNTWQSVSKYFPERLTTVDFAAVDSITTAIPTDKGGLLVFENEMERVKGYNLFPTYSDAKLELCIKKAKLSLSAILNYQKVFLLLNVRLYKEAMTAIRTDNMVFIDCEYKQGAFLQAIPILRSVFEEHADPLDIY